MRKFIYLLITVFVFVGCNSDDEFEEISKLNSINNQNKVFGGSPVPDGVSVYYFQIQYDSLLSQSEILQIRSYYFGTYPNIIFFNPNFQIGDSHIDIWSKRNWKPGDTLEAEIQDDSDISIINI